LSGICQKHVSLCQSSLRDLALLSVTLTPSKDAQAAARAATNARPENVTRTQIDTARSAAADELLGRAFATSGDAIILTDASRRVVAANAAAAHMLGFDVADLHDIAVRTLYATEDDWNRVESLMSAAALDSAIQRIDATLRKKTGALMDTAITITPLFDEHRQLRGVVQTLRTIMPTHVADAHALQNDAPNQMRLARGVAHDFNNLLAIIAGNIQLVEATVAIADARTFLNEAAQACAIGAQLTQRLMAFAEDQHFAAVEIDIAALVQAQMPLLARAVGRAITLNLNIAAPVARVLADKSAFENALLNLVLNARDAIADRGTITISVSQRIDEKSNARGEVCITVTDTGTGMTQRVRERAFDPFFSTKAPGRGAGLGLASVAGFAKQSGGKATLESTIGKGTTAVIWLPTA
jgi:PAS domain S-box-containing protein